MDDSIPRLAKIGQLAGVEQPQVVRTIPDILDQRPKRGLVVRAELQLRFDRTFNSSRAGEKSMGKSFHRDKDKARFQRLK
jgi:hypothetical protein